MKLNMFSCGKCFWFAEFFILVICRGAEAGCYPPAKREMMNVSILLIKCLNSNVWCRFIIATNVTVLKGQRTLTVIIGTICATQ